MCNCIFFLFFFVLGFKWGKIFAQLFQLNLSPPQPPRTNSPLDSNLTRGRSVRAIVSWMRFTSVAIFVGVLPQPWGCQTLQDSKGKVVLLTHPWLGNHPFGVGFRGSWGYFGNGFSWWLFVVDDKKSSPKKMLKMMNLITNNQSLGYDWFTWEKTYISHSKFHCNIILVG